MVTDLETKVGELVTSNPGAARVLAKHGIDFCCGGERPIGEACRALGLEPGAVLAEIAAAPAPAGAPDWSALPLGALCDEIERRYHRPLDTELGRLDALARKVASVHGERHAELRPIAEVYGALRRSLVTHLLAEEQEVFPAIRATGRAGQAPLSALRREHEEVGEALRALRRLSGGFETPADGCQSYRALYDGLEALERDIHEHVHVENNILLPRAAV